MKCTKFLDTEVTDIEYIIKIITLKKETEKYDQGTKFFL